MGERARAAFDTWYSPAVSFDTRMDGLARLHERREGRAFPKHGLRDPGFRYAARFGLETRARVWAGRQVRSVVGAVRSRRRS